MWIELSVITLCLEIKWLPDEEIHVLTSWQVFEEQNNYLYLEHKPPVILEKSIITKKKAGIYNGLSVQPPESLPQSYQADKQIHKLKLFSVFSQDASLKSLVAITNTGWGNQEEKGERGDI